MSTYTKLTPSLGRPPTLNINHADTILGRGDPLKRLFNTLFEILPAGARGHVVAVTGEFIGTLIFIFLAFSGVEVASASSNKDQGEGVSTKADGKSPEALLYIALSAGFSLAVVAWTFFRISGGLFNPAISLGMALIGAISWFRCLLLCIAQTVATIAASYMVYALFNGGLNVDVGLGGGTSNAQGVLIEMLLTAQLTFTIFMLAAEQHDATPFAPIGIGLSLFIAELIGVFWTGGAVNPARALAPCIVNRNFPDYHWIYWVGPTAGVFLAVIFYKFVKALEYESAQEQDEYLDSQTMMLPRAASPKPSSIVPLAHLQTMADPTCNLSKHQPQLQQNLRPRKKRRKRSRKTNRKRNRRSFQNAMQTRAESCSVAVAPGLAIPLALKTSTNRRSVRSAGTDLETGGEISGAENSQRRVRFTSWSTDQKVSSKNGQAWLNGVSAVLTGPIVLLFSCFAEAVKNSRSGRYSYLY